MKRLLEFSIIAAFALSATQARATVPDPKYLSPDRHFFQADNPVVIHFDNSGQDNLSNATAVEAVKAAFDQWQSIPCTTLTFNTSSAATPAAHTTWLDDGANTIAFNAPPGTDEAPGVLAATVTYYDAGQQETVNGHTWKRITNFDIVFNKNISWTTRANVLNGSCSAAIDIQTVAVHEIGHGVGYAHSCEQNDSCVDPLLESSIMDWVVGPCQSKDANAYDINQHSVAYGFGAAADFNGDNPVGGPLPLDVTFTPSLALTSAAIVGATWTYGDGITDSTTGSTPATHSYSVEGRYSVGMTMTGNAPQCGASDFTQTVRKTDYVTACDPLTPAFHFSKSGKTVHFFSDTLGGPSGCLSQLNWDFGDGTTGTTQQPIHTYAQGGTYTVSLTAIGPAGTSSPATQSVSTGGGKKGCSVDGIPDGNIAAAIGALGAAVLMSLVTITRRKNAR